MSSFLLRIEAIEAKVLSYSCPRGTSGRLHSLRLRRRFQHPIRSQSAGAAQLRARHDEDDILLEPSLDGSAQDGQFQDVIGKIRQLGISEDCLNPKFSKGQRLNDGPPAPHSQYTYKVPAHPPKYRGIAKHATRAERGDTFYDQPAGTDATYMVPSPHGEFQTSLAPPTVGELYDILREKNPNAILQFVTRLGPWYRLGLEAEFRELPADTFSELLHSLDPDVFLGRYQQLHKEISPDHSSYNGLFNSRRLKHESRDFFMKSLKGLIKFRLVGGHILSLSDYQHFLRCARAVGDPKSAETIWKSMAVAGISPDTICYNHYLGVKVESDTLNGDQRQKVRVTPRNLEVRQWSTKPPRGYEGYGVGDNGLKYQTTLLFDKMIASGTAANEETMCLMMVALAKEGDVDGVKNILNKVWGIHVEKLLALGEEGIGLDFPYDSPTQPSSLLLQSIAHVFGINNSIPVALRLIDFVSRRYSLDIPLDVWEELLERTFVLGVAKSQKRNKGFADGSLPVAAVSNLWATLTAEPYNVQPTMFMYDKLIRNLLQQQRFGQTQERMEEARALHKRAVAKYGRLVTKRAKLPADTPSEVFQKLDGDITFLSLRVHRNRQYIRQWCSQLIKGSSKSIGTPDFSRRGIQHIVDKWDLFLPRLVEYKTPTGSVSFPSGSKALNTERVGRLEARTMGDGEGFAFEDTEP